MEKTLTPKYKKQDIQKTENYNKSYYEVNKLKWREYNEKQKQNYFNCEICKCSVKFSHKNLHFKTNKHLRNLENSPITSSIEIDLKNHIIIQIEEKNMI